MHDDQIDIDTGVVSALIAEQFPIWNGLPIEPLAGPGTVNAIFRVGDEVAARFPLRAGDPDTVAEFLRQEQIAAAAFADAAAPVPSPRPLGVGAPGHGYPLPWAVQTWLPGSSATPSQPDAVARSLAEVVIRLRETDTDGRTHSGVGRGGDLQSLDDWVNECLSNSGELIDVDRAEGYWLEARELPRTAPDVMSHGDLIPCNVLVARGRLAGLLDTGGFGPADPALDALAAWHLFDDEARDTFRRVLGCDDLEWARSRAWAFEQALGAAWYYRETNAAMFTMGMTTLARVLPGV